MRRQFGTPQARLTPRFAAPHLLVGVLLPTIVWLVLPLTAAWAKGYPLVARGQHADVGGDDLRVGDVVAEDDRAHCRRAGVDPGSGGRLPRRQDQSFAQRFTAGETPVVYAALLLAAAASYPVAAWRLLRLSDLSVADSDDFAFEPSTGNYGRGMATERLSQWRDMQIEWRLGRVRGAGTSVARRRVPSAVSWGELGLFAAATLVLMPVVWWLFDSPEACWTVLMVGTGLMLFAPLSLWRFRCNVLATEALRPAPRSAFARQLVLAMGLDCVTWCAAASVVLLAGYSMLLAEPGFTMTGVVAHLTVLWGMAALVYGIGILTLRFRYWLPLFVLLYLGAIAVGMSFTAACEVTYVYSNRLAPMRLFVMYSSFSLAVGLIGLLLAWHTYRRWNQIDLT